VNIYADVGDFSKQFARREKLSTVVIPFAQSDAVVDHIDVDWYESYEAVYFAVTPVFYGGYTLTEVPLGEAWHSFKDTEINNDVLVQLQDIDGNYVEMDSTSFLTLRFNTISPPEEGMLRDYVFETNGRYVYGGGLLRPSMVANPNNQPHQYSLHQNYPNPFNPKTLINFEIPNRVNVKICVYNALGQLIKVLLDDYRDAGSYRVEFDGANLPSGLYIYSIEAGSFADTKKMVLVK
jgi:hypothetical protein